MKSILLACSLLLLPACGGPDVSKFTGGMWKGSATTSYSCGSQSNSNTSPLSFELTEDTTWNLTYQSVDGCAFGFTVNKTGDTATLSNGPVSCSTTQNGATTRTTVTAYTLHTADGHHLDAHIEGTISNGSQSCSFVLDGTASK